MAAEHGQYNIATAVHRGYYYRQIAGKSVAVADSHSHHSTVTEKLQKCADLKGGLTTKWRLNTASIIPLLLSTEGIITDRLQGSLKLSDLCPALYIVMQIAAILST